MVVDEMILFAETFVESATLAVVEAVAVMGDEDDSVVLDLEEGGAVGCGCGD